MMLTIPLSLCFLIFASTFLGVDSGALLPFDLSSDGDDRAGNRFLKGSPKCARRTKSKSKACKSATLIPSRDKNYTRANIIGNMTYNDLATKWLFWAYDRPNWSITSPIIDTDGTLNEEDSGVVGVHFLARAPRNITACRETRVSTKDIIFFPIAEFGAASFPEDTEESWYYLLRPVASFFGVEDPLSLSFREITKMFCVVLLLARENVEARLYLDGCELNAKHDYTTTDVVTYENTSPEDPFWGVPPGSFGASGGYFAAIGPLSAGKHSLHFYNKVSGINYVTDPFTFTGEYSKFGSDVQYNLIVY